MAAYIRNRRCPATNKLIHTKKAAQYEAGRLEEEDGEQNVTFYPCPDCSGWHVGHDSALGVLVNDILNSLVD